MHLERVFDSVLLNQCIQSVREHCTIIKQKYIKFRFSKRHKEYFQLTF